MRSNTTVICNSNIGSNAKSLGSLKVIRADHVWIGYNSSHWYIKTPKQLPGTTGSNYRKKILIKKSNRAFVQLILYLFHIQK